MGNIFGRWVGSEPDLPAVGSGSHADAIPQSGLYDGCLGVIGPIEAIAALKRAGFKPKRSIEALMFTSEEPPVASSRQPRDGGQARSRVPRRSARRLDRERQFLDAAKAAG